MLYYRARREGSAPDLANGFISPGEAADISDWNQLRARIVSILEANRDDQAAAKFNGGIAMQLAPYEGFTVNVWEYLLANRVEPDSDGMIDFRSDEVIAKLQMLAKDLRDDDEASIRPLILFASLHHREEESLRAFQNGETPFLRHWPRAYRALSCEAEFEVGMVPMPGGVLGGQSLAVSRFSKRKEQARKLVEFLTSEESQQALFTSGGFAATRAGVYADAGGTSSEEETQAASQGDCEEVANLWPDVGALFSALTGQSLVEGTAAIPGTRPTVERYTQFSRAFSEFLHGQLESSSAPELDTLQTHLNDALDG